MDWSLKLEDELLGKYAEALGVPADEVVWVSSHSCQLGDRVGCILARAVEHFEVKERICLLSLRFLLLSLVNSAFNLCRHYLSDIFLL